MEGFIFCGRMGDLEFLSRLFDLKSLPSNDSRFKNAHDDIWQHTINNADYEGNWVFTDDRFFPQNVSDNIFLSFLCEMAHPLVRPDHQQALRIITIANDWLKIDGWELYREREIAGGNIYQFRQTNAVQKPKESELEGIWEENKLRFFISHRDAYKKKVSEFSEQLAPYGICGFVAHENIESNSKWKDEILKALQSMDACICFVTPDFHKSNWTNQEVGYAIAKGVPMYFYSVDGGIHEGFKFDQQAFKKGLSDLINGIKKDFQGHPKFKRIFIERLKDAVDGSFDHAKNVFFDLVGLEFNDSEIDEIVGAFSAKAKYSNQLNAVRHDEIKAIHKSHPRLKGYTYYWEYLDKNILQKHSQKIYKFEDNSIIRSKS